jgi:hypothetical protein
MRRLVLVLGCLAAAALVWMTRPEDRAGAAPVAHDAPRKSGREPTELVVPENAAIETRRDPNDVETESSAAATVKSSKAAARSPARLVVVASDEFGRALPRFGLLLYRDRERDPEEMRIVGRDGKPQQGSSYTPMNLTSGSGAIELDLVIDDGDAWHGFGLVCALGRTPVRFDLELVSGAEWRSQFALVTLPSDVYGFVRDAAGRPVAGVTLEARGSPSTDYGPIDVPDDEAVVSGGDGAFAFAIARRATTHVVVVGGAGYSRMVLRAPEIGEQMEVRLPATARLSGRLRGPNGRVLDIARVQLQSVEPRATEWLEPALVVTDGEYMFEAAPLGAIDVNVWRAKQAGHWVHLVHVPLVLHPGADVKQDIEVPDLP